MTGATEMLDQKYIYKSNIEMLMEIKFMNQGQNDEVVIHSDRVSPESCKGFNGLYFFPLGCKLPDLFNTAGAYIFSFSLMELSCKSFEKRVTVKPSRVVKWKHLNDNQSSPLVVRVGSSFPTLVIACYDIYDNRAPFQDIPELTFKLQTAKGLLFETHRMKISLSRNKFILIIKDVLVKSKELDKIRPGYVATLMIASSDELLSVSITCQVYPGYLKNVELNPPLRENQLLPGYVFEKLALEMFDAYGNHVLKGSEVTLSVDGFHILDHVGMIRKVDDKGRIDFSGLLKVTAGYGGKASISVLSEDKTIFKQEFSTVTRNLRIASGVPHFCTAGGHLENIEFEVVNPNGDVDMNIHHSDKDGQIHMLTIKSNSFNADQSIRYTFQHGCCTIPSIPIPPNEGTFCFEAAHSRYTELSLIIKVPVVKTPNVKYVACQPPSSDNSIKHEHISPSFNRESNLMISLVDNDEKVPVVKTPNVKYVACQPPSSVNSIMHEQMSPSINPESNLMISLANTDEKEFEDMCNIAEVIGAVETNLDGLNKQKDETEQEMYKLLENVQPYQLRVKNCLYTQDELKLKIESMENAAAVLCSLSGNQKHSKCILEDIIGLVALIGTVQSPDLSRILAEYLGEDKMLAVICRSFDAASSLESYKQSGAVDVECGLHAEAATLGKAIYKRFLVICLEDIRPYTGCCQGNDPQRKLVLPDPTLANGKTPTGFIGYAVNMVDLGTIHLQIRTASGHGLRETVLFSLFRKLQVYETRECMVAARACIQDGAVSLDGGILRENGLVALGYGDPCIYFPSENRTVLSPETGEIMRQIEEKKSELRLIEEEIRKLTKFHKKCLKKFEKVKARYSNLLDKMEPVVELLEYKTNVGNSSNDKHA